MPSIVDPDRLLRTALDEGRTRLLEHDCYHLLAAMGAEAIPVHRVLRPGDVVTDDTLAPFAGERVVLKIASPDIVHKTEARGVRVVPNDPEAVRTSVEAMLREVPETYAVWLDAHPAQRPADLEGLTGDALASRLAERIEGVLLCSFVQADASGFAAELFVGVRSTTEFGPILTAGLGGVEMELLARETRPGAAVAIAPTGTVDGRGFLELFRRTLSYQRLSGSMRGKDRLVDDDTLAACFQSFIDLANHCSAENLEAPVHLDELEVNPFVLAGGRVVPLDGVCTFRSPEAPPQPRPLDKIAGLLRPRSAATVGVSEKQMNMGRIILNNLFQAGFDRDRTWVVRPGAQSIDGAACVPTVADLPEKVDLFVVAVGAPQVPAVVDDLVDHDRANAVILIPGGLGEKEGSQDVERRLKEKIRAAHRSGDGGPVFLGGNSLGVISHPGRYDTMFIPETKLPKSRGDHRRPVCFLSQSGAFIIANLSRMPWLDPAYALSIGNQVDLTASDLLRFIKDDDSIEVFAVYMEGFQPGDGLAFARAVRETVALGKDVVFYKAGRTSEGRSATAGHTASVAGDYAVCANAVAEAGAMVARDFNEFSDLLRLAVRLRGRRLTGDRLLAMSNAGFESVGMADSIRGERTELHLARLSDATRDELAAILAEHRLDGLVDVKNPFDVTPMADDAAFARLVERALADDGVDLMVAGIVPLTPAMQTLAAGEGHRESVDAEGSIARMLAKVVAAQDKPVVAVVDSGRLFDPLADALETGGVPTFRSADRAVRVLCHYVSTKLRNASRDAR